jgi:hypothetical protein
MHFVGSSGWERNIFHCTKMPAAFTHAKIKIKLTVCTINNKSNGHLVYETFQIHNCQKRKDKVTNNDLQNIHIKLRNKSWKPECVGNFNMDWRILVFYPEPETRDTIY